MSRKTVAVIVTFNRLKELQTTLEHTLEQGFCRVVVVDNHSDDGTAEWLDVQDNPVLHVIHSGQNLGGAGGFHLGFKFAAEELPEAEWLVCFDDDAYPQPDTLKTFQELEVPADVGSLAAAVYMPDGRVSEMNRPGLNPFWHLRELIRAIFTGSRGFHVSDEDYKLDNPQDIDASSFVGFFLRLSLIREKKIGLPRTELFIYADDIIYILEARKAGVRHLFVPQLKFTHACNTLVNQKPVYRPLWKAYYTYRNGLEMYRIASGIFYPLVLMVKIPKYLFAARFYQRSERMLYLAVTVLAIWHGLWRDYSKTFSEITQYSQVTETTTI